MTKATLSDRKVGAQQGPASLQPTTRPLFLPFWGPDRASASPCRQLSPSVSLLWSPPILTTTHDVVTTSSRAPPHSSLRGRRCRSSPRPPGGARGPAWAPDSPRTTPSRRPAPSGSGPAPPGAPPGAPPRPAAASLAPLPPARGPPAPLSRLFAGSGHGPRYSPRAEVAPTASSTAAVATAAAATLVAALAGPGGTRSRGGRQRA